MLSKFWGRPIYLGATVLLPRDYDRETMSYPVNYEQGHFSLNAPYGFDGTNDFSKAWLSDNFPRMIAVTFQHPTPYFDDSYAVKLEGAFRSAVLPAAQLGDGGCQTGGQALFLHPRRRHLLLEQLHEGAGEVDEDHHQSALRGVLHVRQQ